MLISDISVICKGFFLLYRYPVGFKATWAICRKHAILDDQNTLERWKCIGLDRPAAAHSNNRMREAGAEVEGGVCICISSFILSVLLCSSVMFQMVCWRRKQSVLKLFVVAGDTNLICVVFSVVLDQTYF